MGGPMAGHGGHGGGGRDGGGRESRRHAAHHEEEGRDAPPRILSRYKTKLCSYYMDSNGAFCPHGAVCQFAHGESHICDGHRHHDPESFSTVQV